MPDAPAPVYNAQGVLIEPWSLTLAYDPTEDALVLTRRKVVFARGRTKVTQDRYHIDDLEDALAALQVAARTYHARRLF